MPGPTEDTINELMAEYLRDCGFDIISQESISLPGNRRGQPDFTIKYEDMTFYGEGEWSKKRWQGMGEANDYSRAPSANGAFMISYPEELKNKIGQMRIGDWDPTNILSEYSYSCAFIRYEGTDLRRSMDLSQISEWLEEHIQRKISPQSDKEEIISILTQTVDALTEEFEEGIEEALFRTVFGGEPNAEQSEKSAKSAAAYILVDQLMFYQILSSRVEKYEPIVPEKIKRLEDISKRFNKVLEDDYEALFTKNIAEALGPGSMDILRKTIRSINGLSPEHMEHEMLGKLFHSLIPLDVRKPIGAFYTKEEAADILSNLTIENFDDKVMDPACGSGTLLVSAYQDLRKLIINRKGNFSGEDHQKLLGEQLTGIDAMLFAGHLSTMHLALQTPNYYTNDVRIGIEDSLKYSLGDSIKPLKESLPEGFEIITLDEFQDDPPKSHKKKSETAPVGSLSPEGKAGTPIELKLQDVILMNPPFSRQQVLVDFESGYKDDLKEKYLSNYKDLIHGRMSYFNYFIMNGDDFLEEDGRMGMVLPVNILRGNSTRKLRKWLLNNYFLEYIIVREDEPNFSEQTSLRECLMVIRKKENNTSFNEANPQQNFPINYVILDDIKSDDGKKVRNKADIKSSNRIKIVEKNIKELDYKNLFRPVSMNDSSMIDLWDEIRSNEMMIKLFGEKSVIEEIRTHNDAEPSRAGLKFWQASIDNPNISDLRWDRWIVRNSKSDRITAEFAKEGFRREFKIPKTSLEPLFRKGTERGKMDTSNLEEYVVTDNFPEIEDFYVLSDVNKGEVNFKQWRNYIYSRKSQLSLRTRFNLGASGTRLLSYFDRDGRVWARDPSTLIGPTGYVAIYLCMYFNSTLNLLQVLVERAPQEGNFTQIHQYILEEDFVIPNPQDLSEEEMKNVKETWKELKHVEFPSLITQLAMEVEREKLEPFEVDLLEIVLDDTSKIGEGFPHRRKMDEQILKTLGYKEDEINKTLEILYLGVLKQLLSLKAMMRKMD